MKTILITCFTGLISRNILATDAFKIMRRRSNLRLVIITPQSREVILRREFGGPNVVIEAVRTYPLRGIDRVLWVAATNLLNTQARRVQRLAKLERDSNYLDYIFSGMAGFLGRFRSARRLFRAASSLVSGTPEYEYLFEKYAPDILFATDIYTPLDVKLMRLARERKVRTVGMVRSWDNVTSKTLLTFIPEIVVVSTERMKNELARYGDVDPRVVFCCGIPHYDHYTSSGRTSRADFFGKFGLDPSKKLVLFTPPSEGYLKYDPVSPVVLRALEKLGVQVLVRLPIVGKADLGGYRPAPGVVFDEPGNSPDFTEAHLSRTADRHLADSIFHSNVVVTWASTMIIDAIVFDKPVVLVGFDAVSRPYGQSIRQYYDYDHQRDIIACGGVRLAKSPEELTNAVSRYLSDPALDQEGRKKTVDAFCGARDGKAGERLANFILHFI